MANTEAGSVTVSRYDASVLLVRRSGSHLVVDRPGPISYPEVRLLMLQGIVNRDIGGREIADVSRHDSQAVNQRRCGDQGVTLGPVIGDIPICDVCAGHG